MRDPRSISGKLLHFHGQRGCWMLLACGEYMTGSTLASKIQILIFNSHYFVKFDVHLLFSGANAAAYRRYVACLEEVSSLVGFGSR